MTEGITRSGTSLVGAERRTSRSLLPLVGPIVVVVALIGIVPSWIGHSRLMMGLAITGLLFACYGIAFNLLFGSTGQLFLSIGALAGLGAYGAALAADDLGFPILVSVAAGGLLAAMVGGTMSWVAARRSLDVIFTGIVTLAFSLSFENLLLGLRDITGGETGIVVSASAGTFLRNRISGFYVLLAMVGLFLLIHGLLRRSHIGWAFRALRDDEVAAELSGVNVARYRIYAGLIGSAMLGTAGAVYAFVEGFLSPRTFGFGEVDVVVIVMLAFGGIGALVAPVLGAVVFTILNEILIGFGQVRVVAYGVLIIVLFLGFRRGVIPTAAMLLNRYRSRSPTPRPDSNGD